MLVFSVLKPLLRQLTSAPKAGSAASGTPPALAGPAGGDGKSIGAGMGGAGAAPAEAAGAIASSAAASATTLAYEQQVAQARTVVAQDPARVAQVVKSWVQADG